MTLPRVIIFMEVNLFFDSRQGYLAEHSRTSVNERERKTEENLSIKLNFHAKTSSFSHSTSSLYLSFIWLQTSFFSLQWHDLCLQVKKGNKTAKEKVSFPHFSRLPAKPSREKLIFFNLEKHFWKHSRA